MLLSPPSGFDESPYPRRSVATTVNSSAKRGAILCHITCVSGLPCSSSNGGPLPPWRRWIVAPSTGMSVVVKFSNMKCSLPQGGGGVLLAKELRQLVHVLELLDLPDQVQHRLRLRLVEPAPGRALAEFLRELLVGHGIRRAALAEVCLPLDHLSVGELDLDEGRHLVEARGLGLGMHAEIHFPDHGLHVRAVNDLVGELLEAALALEQQDGHAEFH